MNTQLTAIFQFVVEQFATSWPYLLITIPLAVAVKLSGASRLINRALSAQPLVAIVLATVVGAFSPFCSCSVIPVVASLLIGGVPLAPVMSFWIASPSMDPEIFFLSVSTLGWELSLWRLGSTLVLSLAAGFITYFLTQRGWLGSSVLRTESNQGSSLVGQAKEAWAGVVNWLSAQLSPQPHPVMAAAAAECSACMVATSAPATVVETETPQPEACGAASTCGVQPSFGRRLLAETWAATLMVVKFMLLAYILEALILLYVPQEWIVSTLGADQPFVIVWAALLGVPIYTSNLAAIPLVGGLLAQGMSPAAALAFLIAGPTTTLPAMAAVAGLIT